jgi:hypothetical protein
MRKNSFSAPEVTRRIHTGQTNRSMLFTEAAALCCENHAEHEAATPCGKSRLFYNFKADVPYWHHHVLNGQRLKPPLNFRQGLLQLSQKQRSLMFDRVDRSTDR